jgi:uncharacterized protein YkwD
MHKSYCTCPRCHRGKRIKIGLVVGIAGAVAIGVILSWSAILTTFNQTLGSISAPSSQLLIPTERNGESVSVETDDESTDTPAANTSPNGPQSEPSQLEPIPTGTNEPSNSDSRLEELRLYALALINSDRADAGLPLVELSDNKAAQVQAEDILETGVLSHWMSDGMKPYMSYTKFGGLGNVGQNAAFAGYSKSQLAACYTPLVNCATIDVKAQIKSAEYGMMYDDASSDWGHRDNIIDPHHTHVSIGIASDRYSFAMIQNFEDNYLEFDEPITTDNRHVTLSGTMLEDTMEVYGISIFYDSPPTPEVYEEHKNDGFYDSGISVAGVAPPPSYYDQTINIPASSWRVSGETLEIKFDLEPAIRQYNDGVYTVVLWLDDGAEPFPATSYSIFVD